MLLLLATLAHADSFLTSVELPVPDGVTLPAAGPCASEVARLASSGDAFEHAMVLGACHGYASNEALVANVAAADGPFHSVDVAWTLMYAATYGSTDGPRAAAAARAALREHPDDPRVRLVVALVLAQDQMFVLHKPWDKKTKATREIVALVREAEALNRAKPVPRFDEAYRAAVEYLVLYGAFAGLGG